jgi:hypothetical protein
MPTKFHHLRIRLKTEQHRLLNWADAANLTEDCSFGSTTLRLNEPLIQDVLRAQERILAEYWNADNQYRLIVEDAKDAGATTNEGADIQQRFPSSRSSIESRALRCVDKMRQYPKRIRWAAFDRERFECLLAQLSALNDAMTSLLESHQQRTLHQAQKRTSMQILQLNHKVDQLLQLADAGNMQFPTAQFADDFRPLRLELPEQSTTQQNGEELAKLARFKALKIVMNPDESSILFDSTRPGMRPAEALNAASCKVFRSESPTYTRDIERSEGLYDDTPVWMEWKYYDPVLQVGNPDPVTQTRMSILADLLSSPQKPAMFHTPACVGFFNDALNNRFGLVFRRPDGPASSYSPVSLFDLMLDEAKPSLTARVRLAHTLATAVQYLHATDWIHKALRSNNVIFFAEPGCPDLSSPYMCGFGLARPSQSVEMTEQPDTTPLYNLYRHPLAHSNAPKESIGGFQKAFDIYSFGLLLLELALWMPLHRILGVEDENVRKHFRPGVTRKIRSTLLANDGYIAMVSAAAGDLYGGVIKSCLGKLAEAGSDSSDGFHEEVVVKLEKLVV